jgi:hypothetical protein
MLTESESLRFWEKVNKSGPISRCRPDLGACWLWTSYINERGYGRFFMRGKSRKAQIISWMSIRGPIPQGKVLDHLCRVLACVNPSHLEIVTQKENVLRGYSLPAINFRKTYCINGHPLFGKNCYLHPRRDGRMERECRICREKSNRALRQKKMTRP